MPIIDKEVWTKWSFSNREWLIDKGYEYHGKLKEPILVKVIDLSPSSCIKLNCECDICREPFKRSFCDSPRLYEGIALCKDHAFKENAKTKLTKKDLDMVKKMYWEEFKSTDEIGEILGCSKSVVCKFMTKYKLEKRDASEAHKTHYNFIDKEKIIDLYVNQEYSRLAIENKTGVSIHIINNILNEKNIKIRDYTERTQTERWQKANRSLFLTKEELKNLYISKGLSTVEIGNMYGLSDFPVWNLLKHYNIPARTMSEVWETDSHRNKIISTNQKNHGCDYITSSEQHKTQKAKTFKLKYGVDNPFKLDYFQ